MEDKSEKRIRRKSFISGVIVTLVAVALFYFAVMLIPAHISASRPDSIQMLRKAKEIERVINKYYLNEIDEQKQTDTMFLGQVAGLGDKYSTYYTKEEYQKVQEQHTGKYTGIGITIMQDTDSGQLRVTDVMEDSPAAEAGIEKGDVLLEINGESADGMSSSDAAERITENSGKSVQLLLEKKSSGTEETVSVTPSELEMHTVSSEMKDGNIGYIKIRQFSKVTTEQYKEAYEELEKQGMQKLIIDLRDNPGGLVQSACDILETILPKGVIVYEEDKNGNKTYHNGKGESPIEIPLAVLVNGDSASASEIFTGAVKDYGVGTIVGTKTFGKGIVQNFYVMSDGSVLQLTTTKYFTPDGHNIHGTGIEPDVEVEEGEDDSTDLQLERAIEVVNSEEGDS